MRAVLVSAAAAAAMLGAFSRPLQWTTSTMIANGVPVGDPIVLTGRHHC
jgi:hypothetical protein